MLEDVQEVADYLRDRGIEDAVCEKFVGKLHFFCDKYGNHIRSLEGPGMQDLN